MKRVIFLLIIISFIFAAGFFSATDVADNIPIQIQTLDSSGNVITGTFEFQINISNSITCSPVLYSYTSTKTTDSRGIVSYSLENVNLAFDEQYWFCYYRDGVLKETIKAARVPYAFMAKNTTVSGLKADTNLDLGNHNVTAAYFFGDGSHLTGVSSEGTFANLNISGTLNVSNFLFANGNSTSAGIFDQSYPLHIFKVASDSGVPIDVLAVETSNSSTGGGPSILFRDPGFKASDMARISSLYEFTGNYLGTLAFFTNGGGGLTEKMRITGNGNVGINTTTPQNTLNVLGNANITGTLYVSGTSVTGGSGVPTGAISAFNLAACPTGWVLADGTSGTPDLRGIFIRGSGTNSILKYANGSYFGAGHGTYGNDSFQGHNQISQQFSGTGSGTYRTTSFSGSYASLTTASGSTDYVANLFSSDGTNGVPRTGAETSPAYYATIYCVKTSEDTPVSNTIWGTSANYVVLNNQSQSLNVNNTLVVDSVNGRVGIGTTTPLAKLDINTASSSAGVIIESNSSLAGTPIPRLGLVDAFSNPANSSLAWYLENYATNFRISTQPNISATGSVKLFINGSSGNVGIGTSSPTQKLDVNGSINITNSGCIYFSTGGSICGG